MKRSNPKENPAVLCDGICRNDHKIQSSCTTASKVAQKVKGKHSPKSTEPFFNEFT